ncbi:hypothetical protein M514_15782 [Trichuris suis]|uniref:Uncharacterized protein n=1 Tax=Trichuris suis TaxID=68888 RepID=A0A085NRI4_9BILA|nr:hypothetical protein M514_15782 [Trichuris suis]
MEWSFKKKNPRRVVALSMYGIVAYNRKADGVLLLASRLATEGISVWMSRRMGPQPPRFSTFRFFLLSFFDHKEKCTKLPAHQ